jgi:hypothetical protein
MLQHASMVLEQKLQQLACRMLQPLTSLMLLQHAAAVSPSRPA